MCSPDPPKAPEPTGEEQPRFLLSRRQFQNMRNRPSIQNPTDLLLPGRGGGGVGFAGGGNAGGARQLQGGLRR